MYRYLVTSHAPHRAFDLLGKISLRLMKYAPDCVDLRGLAENPLKASYLSPDQKFLFDVNLDQCLGLHSAAFDCSSTSAHPFIRTLQAFVHDGCSSYVNSPLKVFYDSFQPRSAAEAVGLSAGLSHPELATRSPFASSLPWDFLTPVQNETFLRAMCARDYAENGFALTAAAGWKVWGPISDEAGQAEFSRLSHVFNSVSRSGYHRHAALDGDIEGQVMTDGSACRVLISRGQHRIAALAAIGATSAPIRLLPKMISRSEVDVWPNVDRGFYTLDQALTVFDRMFQGRQPDVLGEVSGADRKFA